MKREDAIKLCRLYKGEPQITDNPNNKDDDEFKWYMWRCEYVTIKNAYDEQYLKANKIKINDDDDFETFIKDAIFDFISVFADTHYGGDASPYIKKYFAY